jgi:hypothetical protein
LRYCLDFCLEGLRKIIKYLSENSRSPGKDLNPEPPKYYPLAEDVLNLIRIKINCSPVVLWAFLSYDELSD